MDILLKANWGNPVVETFEYLTTIFATDNGREQRTGERINARRRIQFTSTVRGDTLRDLRSALNVPRDGSHYFPDPIHRAGVVSAPAEAGSYSLTLDAPVPESYVGSRVCVSGGGSSFFATVVAVENAAITFLESIPSPVSIGTYVYRSVLGRLPGTLTLDYVSDDLASCEVVVQQEPGLRNIAYGTAPGPTFKGREVFVEQPNWAAPPSVQIISDYEMVDFNRGVVSAYSPIEYISKITQLTFTGRAGSKMHRLIDFFHRQAGRLNEFWCPSWTSDMCLIGDIDAGANTVRVAGASAYDQFTGSTVETAIAIKLADDTWHYRTVTDAAKDGEDTVLTTEDPFESAIAQTSVEAVHWLNVCRLASDTLAVTWLTDDLAQTVMQVQSLEALEPDLPA